MRIGTVDKRGNLFSCRVILKGIITLKTFISMPSNRLQFFIAGLLIFSGGIMAGAQIFEAGLDEAAAVAVSVKTSTPAVVSGVGENAASFDTSTANPSDRLSMEMLGKVQAAGGSSQTIVSGQYAYILMRQGGLQIVDISSPTPVLRSTMTLTGSPTSIAQAGRYAYVGFATNKIQIIDVSDVAHPFVVNVGANQATSFPAINPVEMVAAGNYLYSVSTSGEFEIFEVSFVLSANMANARRVGFLSRGASFTYRALAVSGHYAYLVGEADDAVHVVDIANPSAPKLVQSVQLYGSTAIAAKDIVIAGQYAYVAEEGASKIAIIDISNPVAASVSKVFSTGTNSKPAMLAVSDTYLYFAKSMTAGVTLIDISQPLAPRIAATFGNEGQEVGSMAAKGDKLYVASRTIVSPLTTYLRAVRTVRTPMQDVR